MSNINPSLTAYVPQDVKTVNVRTGIVPGYITARLEPRLPYYVSPSGQPYAPAANTVAVIHNQAVKPSNFLAGNAEPPENTVVVQLQETNDDSTSGVRTKLAVARVVAGGLAQVTFTPRAQFFEVKGIDGNGPIWIEILTKIDWNEVGFSQKLEPLFPTTEWDTTDQITLVKSAKQTFTSNTSWVVVHNLGYLANPTLLNSAGVDITSLATFSAITTNGYTATFGSAQAGTAYSTQ